MADKMKRWFKDAALGRRIRERWKAYRIAVKREDGLLLSPEQQSEYVAFCNDLRCLLDEEVGG
ncbi:MAG TPA: hypothetical protein VMY98_07790 [Anaerolineae bacterium]|nr:hypothetical protein [Anaerolineae bacterium]